jgi:hypothetical protein
MRGNAELNDSVIEVFGESMPIAVQSYTDNKSFAASGIPSFAIVSLI